METSAAAWMQVGGGVSRDGDNVAFYMNDHSVCKWHLGCSALVRVLADPVKAAGQQRIAA